MKRRNGRDHDRLNVFQKPTKRMIRCSSLDAHP
jgi:hypothetical protein